MNNHSRLDKNASEEAYENAHIDSPMDDAVLVRSIDWYLNAWIQHNNQTIQFGSERIDPRRSTSYTFIWRSWCRYLAQRQFGQGARPDQARPMSATSLDVAHFLQEGPTGSKPNRPVSEVTRRRYFTILQRVYAFCVTKGLLPCSPVDSVSPQETPGREKHEGSALSDAQWRACIQALPLKATTSKSARDAAILRLLFDLGLRPQEIRELRVQDFQLGIADMPTLNITGSNRAGQDRRLPLEQPTAQAIISWLHFRHTMPVVLNHAKLIQSDLNNDSLRSAGAVLFISTQRMELSMFNLLALVRSHILAACQDKQLDPPARIGPQIIRNTRIFRWLLAGEEIALVVAKSGLKNAKGLLHLLHLCPDELKSKLTPANRRDDAVAGPSYRINE